MLFLSPLRRVPDEHGTREVPRSALGTPGVLDLHAPHVAYRTPSRAGRARRPRVGQVASGADVRGGPRRLPEDPPPEWQRDFPHAMSEQAIVSHALAAPGQDMQEKPPEACDGLEGHRARAIASLRVLPPERDLAICTGQKPPIGDRHAMGRACQGAAHRLGACQRRFGRHHPLRLLPSGEERVPGTWGGPPLALPLHAEPLLAGRWPQRRQEGAPEKPAEDAYRQAEACGAWDPRRALQCQPPRWDQAMDVGMMVQGVTPGGQDTEKPDLGAHMRGITRHGLEGLGDGLQQESLDHTRLLQGEGTALGGEGQDHRTGGHLEDLPLPRREPGGLGMALARGAVPIPAGVRADLFVTTVIALGCMAPAHRRAARRDRLEHPALGRRGHRAIAGQVVRPILAGDVRDFHQRAAHGRRSRGASSGKVSRGLAIAWSACGLTWRYRLVVRRV